MKIKRKVLVSILCLMFLFSVTGMAFAAPQDGYYANGHRYDLTLDVTDAAYLTYLEDMAAIDFDFSKVIIVSDNKFAAVQAAVDAGSIPEVLQPNAHEQVGTAIPSTVIPIANNGTVGTGEIVVIHWKNWYWKVSRSPLRLTNWFTMSGISWILPVWWLQFIMTTGPPKFCL